MRTFLLIFGTVALIVLVGGLYVWMQPVPPPPQQITALQRMATQPAAPTSIAPTTSPDGSVIKAGENVWVKVFDEKTARPLWQFRTAHHEPQPDGSINVTLPEAEFFLESGKRVALQGQSGHVIVPGEAMKNPELRGSMGQPSRGEIYDVTISIYPTSTAQRAELVCKVNNISFDNDTLRITSEPFKGPDGVIVPADQVPVRVRGDDYDFDGRGLTILWNSRDRRLQLMEIAHGESLVFKGGFQELGQPAADAGRGPQASPAPRQQPQRPAAPGRRGGAAQSRGAARAVAVSPTTTTKPTTTQPVYRAIFEKDVRITDGDAPVAQADTMRVDYLKKNESDAPIPPPVAPRPAPARGNTRRGGRGAAPATSTAPQPGTIRWTGKLTILPIENNAPDLEPGQANIEMSSQSTPVVLNHAGGEMRCASFSFSGTDHSLVLRNSTAVPRITVTTADGGSVSTPSLYYDGTENVATLEGESSAQFSVPTTEGKPPDIVTANWTDTCLLTMEGDIDNQITLRQADMSGNVRVHHPQIDIQSQTLKVVVAPTTAPTTAPVVAGKKQEFQLEELEARGNVKCDVTPEKGAPEHITSETLTVKTAAGADGRLAMRTVVADGAVHTFTDDKSQDLVAGRMEITLGPTTQPNDKPAIERIIAQREVAFAFKDEGGSDATGKCDQMEVADPQGNMNLHMSGQPFASISTSDMTLHGAIIRMDKKQQLINVTGPGTLEGAQATGDEPESSTYNVAWTTELNLSGVTNHGEINGNVVITSNSGEWDTRATGEKLVVELMDSPTTMPATQVAQGPTTNPIDFNLMGKKQPKSFTLEGNTIVESVVPDEDNKPLKQMYLAAPAVRFVPQDKNNKQFTMVVPSAGRMLYKPGDKAPATMPTTMAATSPTTGRATGPTTGPTTARATDIFSDSSGPTAFSWSRELIFDQTKSQAQLNGNVIIQHDSTTGASYRLEADQVTADFPAGPTTGPTTMPIESKPRNLRADGTVRFFAERIQFEAAHMNYDSDTQILAADGAAGTPVRIFDSDGASTGSFNHVTYNTQTQEMTLREIQGRVRN